MRVVVTTYEDKKTVAFDRHTSELTDEAEIDEIVEDIKGFLLSQLYEMEERVI